VARSWVLGARVAERTVPLLLPEVLQHYETGAEVSFGPIQVRREDELRVSRPIDPLHFPWASLTDYQIRRGFLFLHGTGRLTRKIRVSKIPNVFVLVALLNHIRHIPAAYSNPALAR
jgi:hypothetical protein